MSGFRANLTQGELIIVQFNWLGLGTFGGCTRRVTCGYNNTKNNPYGLSCTEGVGLGRLLFEALRNLLFSSPKSFELLGSTNMPPSGALPLTGNAPAIGEVRVRVRFTSPAKDEHRNAFFAFGVCIFVYNCVYPYPFLHLTQILTPFQTQLGIRTSLPSLFDTLI